MKDAYYFSHDSNAKDDPKCVLLIEQLGLEGYGIYWVLVEILREQDEYRYPLSLVPAMARRYNTTTEKMRTVIMQYGLFSIENDEFFYSDSLLARMDKKAAISAARKENAFKRWGDNANVMQLDSKCNALAMPVKKRKEKESKEKEIDTECLLALSEALREKVFEFVEHRKKIKSPMTDKAVELFVGKLLSLSTSEPIQLAMINEAIVSGWKSVYPLKGQPAAKGPTKTAGGTYKL